MWLIGVLCTLSTHTLLCSSLLGSIVKSFTEKSMTNPKRTTLEPLGRHCASWKLLAPLLRVYRLGHSCRHACTKQWSIGEHLLLIHWMVPGLGILMTWPQKRLRSYTTFRPCSRRRKSCITLRSPELCKSKGIGYIRWCKIPPFTT